VKRVLAPVVLAGVLLAAGGCGSDGAGTPRADSTYRAPCEGAVGPRLLGRIDADGDGRRDRVVFQKAADEPGDDCFAADVVEVAVGAGGSVGYQRDLPVRPRDVSGVVLPGRAARLVLVVQRHPRGGYVAHLSAFDGTRMVGVPADGEPLVAFTATDAPTRYVAARCTGTGFDLVEAVPHEPLGVVPAWDVYRTPFTVDGDALVAGTRVELADNVLDRRLRPDFPDVVRGDLFRGCRG
jgi:hypothetical protein